VRSHSRFPLPNNPRVPCYTRGVAHSHHHHTHGHSHAPANFDRAFAIGVLLNVGFVGLEFAFGFFANSLALIADAGHNLSDVLGLLLAWGATVLARRLPTNKRTYGMRRASILAALGNAALLFVAVGGIAWEAIRRFASPAPVESGIVMAVAAVGIIINTATALLFMRGSHNDLNLRGAFLHMAADALVSLGVVISGFIILLTGLLWLDPVTSLLIVAVIIWGTWGLAKESLDLALDAVPQGINPNTVRQYLLALPGVNSVHDLHIWALSTTEPALTAHLVIEDVNKGNALIEKVQHDLHDKFGIEHTTLQLEHDTAERNCQGCDAETTHVEPASKEQAHSAHNGA
jgi:cobalt-zinc-cadmium efflux system protein